MAGHTNVKLLYEASDFPVFQNKMYETQEDAIACQRGDIRLVENLDTGLVYNESFLPELMKYDSNYQNEQGVSPRFKEHLKDVLKVIDETIGKCRLIEVGCGKGFFLEMLLKQGFEITGFDPAYEGDNPKIEKQYFESGLGIKANGIILRHVLEHIKNPVEFLFLLKEANNGEGLIYIEVPCFDWICAHKAWFDVFYEHVNYFRLTDFHRIFGNIIKSGKSFGGQYLFVVADLSSLKNPVIDQRDRVDFPADFLEKLVHQGKGNQKEVAIWGASKGVIFSLLKSRVGDPVNIVIDINLSKQGKYIAATGLRVMSPDIGLKLLPIGSTIYVMNSNYLEEIKAMSNNAYNYVSVDDE